MYSVIKMLDKNRHRMSKQQYKTLRGQCLAGDTDGALKGFYRILKRSERKCK